MCSKHLSYVNDAVSNSRKEGAGQLEEKFSTQKLIV